MADNHNAEYIVPVVSEELHADAVPVETGTVRVVKRVQTNDEVLEQELRKGRAEVKRVKTDRVVDGPQSPRQVGNTLVIPIVSEILQVQKTWVVTEEIHVTQIEQRETFRQTVPVSREVAEIQRLDEAGNVAPGEDTMVEDATPAERPLLASAAAMGQASVPPERKKRTPVQSILRPRRRVD